MFKVLKGNIQALIKKDKHIVKTIDADLVSLVADFYKLEQPDFTKKNLETQGAVSLCGPSV